MENAHVFHPMDYVSVVRRRMWWLIVPVVVSVVVGAALLVLLPREYQTTLTLGVTLPTISPELVREPQRANPEERMRSISQTLTSTAVLERVVREENLDRTMPVGDAVQRLRARTKVTIPPAEGNLPAGALVQFLLTYTDSSPEVTQRVTNKIADVFVEESSRRREVRAEETSMFIAAQLGESQTRLADLEARLRAAKESFMGALPEQTNANVAMVTGLQQQLETTANAIRGEQDRLSVVERQLESLRAGSNSDPAGAGAPAGISGPALRVVTLERELAVARGNYTDKHPEVVRLRDELAAARADAAAEATRPEADRVATLRVDPTYRALVADREQIRLRVADLQRSESQIRTQIAMYRTRVESAPRVEQQIATLQREYELEKGQYSQLTSRLRNSEMAESLERNRGGERFAVMARAALPSQPSSPNTQRLMIVSLLAGICIGGALAIGREYLDRAIYDARALTDLDLPVLGEIPRIVNA